MPLAERKRRLPDDPDYGRGQVPPTFADIEASRRGLGFEPTTPIEIGRERFVGWYRDYHATAA
jgi:nucleoside-diphosphate-sugar epimerase